MDIFEKELNGELIRTDDPEYSKIIGTIMKTMDALAEYNKRAPFDEGNRKEISKILGYELDKSSSILPPFYADFGRNIKIGKNVWVQQGCTFMDRGGITIGDNVFIAPKVNLVTLNHSLDPKLRSATIAKPIIIEDGVWIGINATILQGVRIGKNSVIGANSVVTRDVPPNTVVAGNPAKVVKKINSK